MSDGSKSQRRFVTMQQHVLKLPVRSFLFETMQTFMTHSSAPDHPAGAALPFCTYSKKKKRKKQLLFFHFAV